MEFLSLSCRGSSVQNVPSGNERGEMDVFAGYISPTGEVFSKSPPPTSLEIPVKKTSYIDLSFWTLENPPGVYSWEFMVGVCRPVPQILQTQFPTKKCNFPHPFSDLAFGQKLCYHMVAVREQTENYSNAFQIHIFLFFSYSFGIETINTFIHSVVPSKTIPNSRPKWAKCVPIFRPKRHKNPTQWGGTYLYSLYKGVPPSPATTQEFSIPSVRVAWISSDHFELLLLPQ